MERIIAIFSTIVVWVLMTFNLSAQGLNNAVLEPNYTISIDLNAPFSPVYEADISSFGWTDEANADAQSASWEKNLVEISIYFPVRKAIIRLKVEDPTTSSWTLQDWDDYLTDPNSN